MKGTVAVDFDGVLHSYSSGWIDHHLIPDPPVEGAIEWLNEIAEEFDLAIFSTRAAKLAGVEAIRAWLAFYGFKRAWDATVTVTAEKPPALVYLDDRGWRFEGPGTFPSAEQIRAARPWNKR